MHLDTLQCNKTQFNLICKFNKNLRKLEQNIKIIIRIYIYKQTLFYRKLLISKILFFFKEEPYDVILVISFDTFYF